MGRGSSPLLDRVERYLANYFRPVEGDRFPDARGYLLLVPLVTALDPTGKGGTGVLSVDGKELSSQTVEHTIPFLMAIDESFGIGIDTRTRRASEAKAVPMMPR
jgi:hypothetical protein